MWSLPFSLLSFLLASSSLALSLFVHVRRSALSISFFPWKCVHAHSNFCHILFASQPKAIIQLLFFRSSFLSFDLGLSSLYQYISYRCVKTHFKLVQAMKTKTVHREKWKKSTVLSSHIHLFWAQCIFRLQATLDREQKKTTAIQCANIRSDFFFSTLDSITKTFAAVAKEKRENAEIRDPKTLCVFLSVMQFLSKCRFLFQANSMGTVAEKFKDHSRWKLYNRTRALFKNKINFSIEKNVTSSIDRLARSSTDIRFLLESLSTSEIVNFVIFNLFKSSFCSIFCFFCILTTADFVDRKCRHFHCSFPFHFYRPSGLSPLPFDYEKMCADSLIRHFRLLNLLALHLPCDLPMRSLI